MHLSLFCILGVAAMFAACSTVSATDDDDDTITLNGSGKKVKIASANRGFRGMERLRKTLRAVLAQSSALTLF